MKVSTKQCPTCGNTHLALLRTFDAKVCIDCGAWIRWTVEPGQQPLLTKQRCTQGVAIGG